MKKGADVMTINGIDYFSPYVKNYAVDRAQAADNNISVDKENTENESKKEVYSREELKKAPAHSNPKDFVFDFNKGPRFNLEGARSRMEDIDVNKELQNMKDDDVLSQYTFFVDEIKSAKANLGADADGIVLLKK